jgi:putative endonuclease
MMIEVYFVYVLRSEITGRRYVGACHDIEERLRRHNCGESKSTKHGAPWKLMHYEQFETRSEAVQRERFYKTGRGREELDKIEPLKVEQYTQHGV